MESDMIKTEGLEAVKKEIKEEPEETTPLFEKGDSIISLTSADTADSETGDTTDTEEDEMTDSDKKTKAKADAKKPEDKTAEKPATGHVQNNSSELRGQSSEIIQAPRFNWSNLKEISKDAGKWAGPTLQWVGAFGIIFHFLFYLWYILSPIFGKKQPNVPEAGRRARRCFKNFRNRRLQF